MLPPDAGNKARRQFAQARSGAPKPKPSRGGGPQGTGRMPRLNPPKPPKPKKFALPPNFHTESQNAAGQAVANKKLQRAVAPLRGPSRKQQEAQGPEGTAVRRNNDAHAERQLRQHVRNEVNRLDQISPRPSSVGVAHHLLYNELHNVLDQNRLRHEALDSSGTTSHRLAAARELRTRYNVPVSDVAYRNAYRLQNVQKFLQETDRHIARDLRGSGGVNPLAAATADFNPIHTLNFLHTIGALSTAGASKLVHTLAEGQEPHFGHIDLTPGIVKKLSTNALKDALDMPAQTVVSLADIGNAGWQAALHAQSHGRQGSLKPAQQVIASTKHLLEHPTEHPLAAALVLRGGISAADRAAGATVRTATRGKFAGTGGRAPIKLYGKQEIPRRYGTGLLTNAAQRALDAKRPGAAFYNKFASPVRDARRELAAAENHRGRVAHPSEDLRQVATRVADARHTLEGRKVGHTEALPLMRDRYLTKRVDEGVDAVEGRRSASVIRARKALRASLPRNLRSALRPALEGTIKSAETAVHDIKVEIKRLQKEHDRMETDGEPRWRVRRNERQQHTFERLLENKDFLANPHPVFDAVDKFVEVQRQMESKLAEHGLLDPVRALRSKLIPVAVREAGAHFDPKSDTVVAEDGTPLSTADMVQIAKDAGVRFKPGEVAAANGVHTFELANESKTAGRFIKGSALHDESIAGSLESPQLGFVSQRGDLGRLGDYFKDSTKQPAGYFQKRTGESAQLGLHNLSFKMVEAQLSHTMNVLAQAEHANEILDRFGLKPKGDYAFTDHAVASNIAQEAADKTGMGWVPVRIGQAVGEQLRAIHEHIDPAAVDMLPESAQLPGKPSWLVMPTVVAKRFQAHTNTLGSNTFQLGFQALTHAFRNTVLPLSPRWLAGNIIELVVRGAVEGTGPLSWAVGRAVLNRQRMLDEGAYNEFVARGQSGSLYASQVRQDHYLGIERWTDQGLATHFAKPLIYAFHHNASPIKHLSWLYGKYAGAIKWITPRIEKEFQAAGIGKAALHELRDMHGNWLNALPHWSAAIDDVAHGLLDTNKQIQFAEYVDKVVGRYNKLSPGGRRLVQGYMPFAMWYANAVRFVLVTLPKDHPIITGWIAAGYVDSEKKRLAEGKSLSYDIPGGKKRMPDFLQGTITEKGGAHLPLQHYTPFGAFSDPGSWQGLVLPQINAIPLALAGKNWMLNDLKAPPGTDATSLEERIKIGLYSATEALLPGLSVARRIREQGGSAYDNSTIFSPKTKPGTKVGLLGAQGSLRKVSDPLRAYPSGSARRGGTAKAPRLRGGNRFLEGAPPGGLSEPSSGGNRFLGG